MNAPGYSKSQKWYSRFILKPLGLNKENDLVLWLLFLFGGLLLFSFWYSQGNVWVALSSVLFMSIVVLTIFRVDYSLYLLTFCIIIFEQFPTAEIGLINTNTGYFSSISDLFQITQLPLGFFSPLEIHFLLICFSVFLMLTLKLGLQWRPIPVAVPALIFLMSILGAVAYGVQKSGNLFTVFMESRALLYFFLMYLLVPQIIQSKRQVKVLIWIFIAGISIKLLQPIYGYGLAEMSGNFSLNVTSEELLFIVTLIIMGLSFLIFKIKDIQKWFLVILLPLLLFSLYASATEGVYLCLAISIGFFVLLLPLAAFKRLIILVSPFLVFLILYGSLFQPYENRTEQLQQQSNLAWTRVEQFFGEIDAKFYEEAKEYELSDVLQESPIVGAGFGFTTEQKEITTDASAVRDNIPQNQIVWLLLKSGVLGLLGFTFFFTSYVANAVKLFSRVKDTYLSIVLRVVVVVTCYQFFVLFFEPQLVYYRSTIFLGALMGVIPVIKQSILNDQKEKTDHSDQEEIANLEREEILIPEKT